MEINKVIVLKIAGAIFGLIIGVVIANLPTPEGLSIKGLSALAVFVCAVIWWMVEVLPDYMTGILMCCAWVVFGLVPFNVGFAAFAGSTVWLLIGALGLAVGVAKSGLLKRIAYFLMSKFPLTFRGQTLALMFTGTVLSPLIPSAGAKIAVVAPFASTISDSMALKREPGGRRPLLRDVRCPGLCPSHVFKRLLPLLCHSRIIAE